MILFYAQSENSEIVVTAPSLTFPGRVATTGQIGEPSLYGVQPVKYTLPEGTTKEFKNTDIEKFIFLPQNNGHSIYRIKFSNSFEGINGCIVTLRIAFATGQFQTFQLPFAKSLALIETKASIEPLTISIQANGLSKASTSASVFVNSTRDKNLNTSGSSLSIDTNTYKSANTGVLEIVGGTINTNTVDQKEFSKAITDQKSKYLNSKYFIDNAANASYFYIYAEACDKTISATKGCYDRPTADNVTTRSADGIGITNNSCDYARRAPGNVTIEHIPGGKTTLASVKYTEENLPQNTDPIDGTNDFDVHTLSTIVNGSGVADSTPTSEKINVDGKNTSIVFEWLDIDSDSEFTRPLIRSKDKAAVVMNSNVGSSDDHRIYYFPVFVTGSSGCTNPTSLNYDANAITDDGTCLGCVQVSGAINSSLAFGTFVDSSASTVDNDDTTNFILSSVLMNFENSVVQYLSTLAPTIWTGNIYNAEDVSLNNFGDQATISGTVVVNNSTLGGNTGTSTLPIFNREPAASSGLNSGRSFVIELTLTLGSCVHYFYKTFGVPFNGCSEPSATNYIPNPLNTGDGTCDFDTVNQFNCDGAIQASLSPATLNASNNWVYTLSIQGTFDENGNLVSNETVYTVIKSYYIDGNFVGQSGSTSILNFFGDPVSSSAGAVQSLSAIVYTITDSVTGCSIELLFEPPVLNQILGCTNSTAENYNPIATEDDGTCLFCNGEIEILSISNPTGSGSGCSSSNNDGSITMTSGVNIPTAYQYYSRLRIGMSWGPWIPLGTYGAGDNVFTNITAGLYEIKIEYQVSSDYMCTVYLEGNDASVQVFGGVLYLSVDTSGCGCTDPEATNYDSEATSDDGSCLRFGCTDSLAINKDPLARVDDGSCVYSAEPDTPLCIPNQLDNNQTYSTFLEGLANCVVNEGTTLLLKTKGGIKCDTIEQVKLSLITYLLNRIGLECMYNCNYIFEHGDSETSCSGKWSTGGPSGQELVWVSGTTYIQGDIIQYTDAEGEVYYIEILVETSRSSTPDTWPLDGIKLKRCENVTLPSGTETYLNTFINFARKFCTVCLVSPKSQGEIMQTTTNTLGDIQFENGDNINLNG